MMGGGNAGFRVPVSGKKAKGCAKTCALPALASGARNKVKGKEAKGMEPGVLGARLRAWGKM